jgi:CO dehydrogenase nickel-insertion accessory protein CooC1
MATVSQIVDIAVNEKIVQPENIGLVAVRPADTSADFFARCASSNAELLGVVPYDADLALLDSRGETLAGLPVDSEAYHGVWHIAEKIFSDRSGHEHHC